MERIILRPVFGQNIDSPRIAGTISLPWLHHQEFTIRYLQNEQTKLRSFLDHLYDWRDTGVPILLPPSSDDDGILLNTNLFGDVESFYRGYFYIINGPKFSSAPATIFAEQGETVDQFMSRAQLILGPTTRIIPFDQFITHTEGKRPEEFGTTFFRFGKGYSSYLGNTEAFSEEGILLSAFAETLQNHPQEIEKSESFDQAIEMAIRLTT